MGEHMENRFDDGILLSTEGYGRKRISMRRGSGRGPAIQPATGFFHTGDLGWQGKRIAVMGQGTIEGHGSLSCRFSFPAEKRTSS